MKRSSSSPKSNAGNANNATGTNAVDNTSTAVLGTADHSRDSSGMIYAYPVISRRAGGVSVGINLNPNNACNWQCVYCQVPGLVRGSAPRIDLQQLETELRTLLEDLTRGDFMQRRVPEEARKIVDIALSGNGEPTSAREFPDVIDIAAHLRDEFGLDARLRVITNGSLMGRSGVQEGLRRLASAEGEVWFKLDAGSPEGVARINNVQVTSGSLVRHLSQCASLCNTWVQTCCFALDGKMPGEDEITAWLGILETVLQKTATKTSRQDSNSPRLCGVHLYGLARPSLQAEAPRLSSASREWMALLGERVKQLGLTVQISP